MSAAAPSIPKSRESELQTIFGQLDRVIAAAATSAQRRSAWASRDQVTACLIRYGWLTRELAVALGRSQSTVSTWASRGRRIASSSLNLPLPPGAPAGSSPADEFVSVATAVGILHVDKHTVRNWIRTGRLTAHRPDRPCSAWRIARRSIEAMQRTNHDQSAQEIAEWYCVAESTVRRWIRTGQLEAERLNRRGIFRDADAPAV